MTLDVNLSTDDTRVGDCRVIAVFGELDLATAEGLRRVLTGALSAEMPWLIIDMSGVGFCDSSGLNVLIGAHRTARTVGGGAAVAAPRATVSVLLHRVGLHRLLPIHDTVGEAIRAIAAQRNAA